MEIKSVKIKASTATQVWDRIFHNVLRVVVIYVYAKKNLTNKFIHINTQNPLSLSRRGEGTRL